MKFSLGDKLIIAKEHVDKGIPLFELQKNWVYHFHQLIGTRMGNQFQLLKYKENLMR